MYGKVLNLISHHRNANQKYREQYYPLTRNGWTKPSVLVSSVTPAGGCANGWNQLGKSPRVTYFLPASGHMYMTSCSTAAPLPAGPPVATHSRMNKLGSVQARMEPMTCGSTNNVAVAPKHRLSQKSQTQRIQGRVVFTSSETQPTYPWGTCV